MNEPQESLVIKHQQDRTDAFQPNQRLDQLIELLQHLLVPVQQTVNAHAGTPRMPVIVLVGCPRAGITFVSQLLAATNAVAYPSNVLSRFAYAPHVGALVQQLLFNPDYDLGNEFSDLRAECGFDSTLGKTRGALGISEFFHFWRRFMPNHEPEHLSPAMLDKVQIDALRTELASIEAVFQKPFMSKAKMLQFNLAFFARAMPELRIIHVRRDPLYVMQSILQARRKYYASDQIWWSVKPPQYPQLKDAEPAAQIAGQVYYTDQVIEQQLAELPPAQWRSVAYEAICSNPHAFLHDLATQFAMPELIADQNRIQAAYPCGNAKRLDQTALDSLLSHYRALNQSGHVS